MLCNKTEHEHISKCDTDIYKNKQNPNTYLKQEFDENVAINLYWRKIHWIVYFLYVTFPPSPVKDMFIIVYMH